MAKSFVHRRPREPKKLSNRRVNIILKVLRQSLDRAVTKGWLSENPARKIDLLREEKPYIDPFSLAEVKTLPARVSRTRTIAATSASPSSQDSGLASRSACNGATSTGSGRSSASGARSAVSAGADEDRGLEA
jgi:hypothetical protein